MDKKTSRRGFLGLFSKGSVGAAAAAFIGVDKASAGKESVGAFNFVCSCGAGLAAEVPKEVGTHVSLTCLECKTAWDFEWMGDHFKTRNYPLIKAQVDLEENRSAFI